MADRLHSTWNNLSDSQIEALFQSLLPVTVFPGHQILSDLKKLKAGTLEVLENRTQSTIYRIRQTNKVYQQYLRNVSEFNSYSDYLNRLPDDQLLSLFKHKEPVYRLYDDNGNTCIERLKEPRFKAMYSDELELSEVEWIDNEPGQIQSMNALKKAVQFLKSSL